MMSTASSFERSPVVLVPQRPPSGVHQIAVRVLRPRVRARFLCGRACYRALSAPQERQFYDTDAPAKFIILTPAGVISTRHRSPE